MQYKRRGELSTSAEQFWRIPQCLSRSNGPFSGTQSPKAVPCLNWPHYRRGVLKWQIAWGTSQNEGVSLTTTEQEHRTVRPSGLGIPKPGPCPECWRSGRNARDSRMLPGRPCLRLRVICVHTSFRIRLRRAGARKGSRVLPGRTGEFATGAIAKRHEPNCDPPRSIWDWEAGDVWLRQRDGRKREGWSVEGPRFGGLEGQSLGERWGGTLEERFLQEISHGPNFRTWSLSAWRSKCFFAACPQNLT